MRRLSGVVFGLILPAAALLAASATAATRLQSGDTCTASGAGTTYTLSIAIPSNAPQQFGFAFAAPGARVKTINVAGVKSALSTQALPPHTGGSWITQTALIPGGSTVVGLTTDRPVKGSFMLVPASAAEPSPAFFRGFRCALSPGAPMPSSAFVVDRNAIYDPAARGWHLRVSISSPGTVSANQLEPTIGGVTSKSVTAKALVQTRREGLKSPGQVTLTLRPTSAGSVVLKAKGRLTLEMNIAFDPTGGRSAIKVVPLTLTR
jgi:hypothetical protein